MQVLFDTIFSMVMGVALPMYSTFQQGSSD